MSLGGAGRRAACPPSSEHGVRIDLHRPRRHTSTASTCTARRVSDFADNPERFAFLAQAALRWAASTGPRYDVVHAHDWQAGLVPVHAAADVPACARPPARPAAVFTIHNLAYQGVFDASWLPRLGLRLGPDARGRAWSTGTASAISRAASCSAG